MEPEVTHYKVVEHWIWSEFADSVNNHIATGWQPLGGVALAFNDGGSIKGYAQAMVKYKDKK